MVVQPMTHLAKLSGNVEWYTPPHVLATVRAAFGREFTFDPASSAVANETVKASRYLTAADDALSTDWQLIPDDVVWMNPPYARGLIGKFVTKFLDNPAAQAAVLVNSDTGTRWYQDLLRECDAFVLLPKRLAFIDGTTGLPVKGAAHAQTLFVFGWFHADKLSELGLVCIAPQKFRSR
jgi:phage N-6-adenine-methyltransferase